jgi:hypothetical protein
MRQRTIPLAAIVLALAAPGLAADSREARLQVGVVVTRQCSVTTSSTIEVTCTRASDAVIQTSQAGRTTESTPLVTTGPGVTGASVPLSSTTTLVTIQF